MQFGLMTLVDCYPKIQSIADRYRQIIDLAVRGEELGYEYIWIGEHHFQNFACPNPIPLLCAIAARTSKIRLGTAVALPVHRDAIQFAEDYAMLDQLSQGRADVVIGAGAWAQGFAGFNQNFSERTDRTLEAVEIMRGAWTKTPFAYEGKYRSVTAVDVQPKPYQQPEPPIHYGTFTPSTMDFAAQEGFHLALPTAIPGAGAGIFKGKATDYRERVAKAGRDPGTVKISGGRWTYVAETDEKAISEFIDHWSNFQMMTRKDMIEQFKIYPKLLDHHPTLRGFLDVQDGETLEQTIAKIPERNPRETIHESPFVGSPERVARLSKEMDKEIGGCDLWWVYSDIGGISDDKLFNSIELFANEVIPQW